MKKNLTIFLQAVIVLIGVGTLGLMLWEPHLEGRNANATTFEVYFKDPFLAYIYLASIPFFVVLYQAFKASSQPTTKAFRTIKYCAAILSVLIVMAGVYVRIFHAKDDDPAGFIAICIVTAFISAIIATAAAVAERSLENKEAI